VIPSSMCVPVAVKLVPVTCKLLRLLYLLTHGYVEVRGQMSVMQMSYTYRINRARGGANYLAVETVRSETIADRQLSARFCARDCFQISEKTAI